MKTRAQGTSKSPRKALSLTSDSTRVRRAGFVALASAIGAASGFVGLELGTRGALAEPRPLSPPHVHAKVACSDCHARGETPTKVACSPCHAPGLHASTRTAHRKLAAEGALTCATCHPAHSGFQALSFGAAGAERWGPGASSKVSFEGASPSGQTVPLVGLGACGRCHALLDPRDPAARCVPPVEARGATWAATASVCFDEHARAVDPPRQKIGKCAAQHGEAHLAATEIAAELTRRTTWQETRPSRARYAWPPALAALFALVALGVQGRRKKPTQVARARLPLVEARRKLPRIDPTTCLGCNACVEACPFDVLEIEAYVARVARPDECCGVVLCAQVCPNGSLVVQEGDAVEGRIETDEELESRAVPGVFLAGDLTGVPLIKNAIAQGDRVARRIHAQLAKTPRGDADADVVVVGGGPAGLSAALRAKDLGLSCIVLEQGSVAASIRSFPRGKIVHDPPLSLPVEGDLWLAEATKEELVAQWERIVRVRGLDVREGHRVTGTSLERGRFLVEVERTGAADSEPVTAALTARRVVLAIGRRGTPRTIPMDVEEGALDKIHYSLADAASFTKKRVLVVGLGDTAMEAAIALAGQPGTRVIVVARGTTFTRGKARNVAEIKRAFADRRLEVRFGTRVAAVGRTGARLEHLETGRIDAVGNDAVFVLVGGIPSWELLAKIGVSPAKTTTRPAEASPPEELPSG